MPLAILDFDRDGTILFVAAATTGSARVEQEGVDCQAAGGGVGQERGAWRNPGAVEQVTAIDQRAVGPGIEAGDLFVQRRVAVDVGGIGQAVGSDFGLECRLERPEARGVDSFIAGGKGFFR